MQAISQGKEFIVLKDGRVLSNKFSFIEPSNYREDVEKIEAGKWKCDKGIWHGKEAQCYCDKEFKEVNGIMTLIEKNHKEVSLTSSASPRP